MCCAAEVALVEERLGACRASARCGPPPVTGKATVVHTVDRREVERALAGRRASGSARSGPRPRRRPGPRATMAALALTAGRGRGGPGRRRRWPIALYLPAILIGGAPVARTGWQRARQGSLDMNALMTVAVMGAMAIGEWGEGASTVVLFSLAQLLEARSLERARRAIGGLMRLAPETALVRGAGGEERRRRGRGRAGASTSSWSRASACRSTAWWSRAPARWTSRRSPASRGRWPARPGDERVRGIDQRRRAPSTCA